MRALGSPVNSDYDLDNSSAGATVYSATPDASNPRWVAFDVAVGDGSKNLDGTGGDFLLSMTVGGVSFDGASQTKTVATSTTRLRFQTVPILVPANLAVTMTIISPNSADSDVDVTVQPYDVAALQPTAVARTLDVSSGGEAGVDWANVGSPTTTVDLSGTTISTSQVAASVTAGVTLADDAITASKYDESTAFPITAANGSQFTEAGGDGDHLTEVQVAGTIKDLDALDTAQDSQHSTTQSAIGTAQADLDTLTGSDGVTLATSQPNYAPAKAGDSMALAAGAITNASLAGNMEIVFETDFASNYDATNDRWIVGARQYYDRGLSEWKDWADNLYLFSIDTNGYVNLVDAPNATAVAAIQSGLATPTNITAGTITTVTNLTNAPTNGDLTAAMKASVNAEVDAAIETYHLDHLLAATYDPSSKPGAADALLNELVENDGGVSRFTANALEQGPGGGSAPSAADIADAVWTEMIVDHSGVSGSTAEQLAAAGASGDPWETALPGSYAAGKAGYIIGNLVSTLSAGGVTIESPVMDSGELQIVIGDDYLNDNGRAISFTYSGKPSFTDGTPTLILTQGGVTVTKEGTVVSSTQIRFDLLTTETDDFAVPGQGGFATWIELSDGSKVTLQIGKMFVKKVQR